MQEFETKTSEYKLEIDLIASQFVLTKTKIKLGCGSPVAEGTACRGNRLEIISGCLYLYNNSNIVIQTSAIEKIKHK